jgi:hypothetical protein
VTTDLLEEPLTDETLDYRHAVLGTFMGEVAPRVRERVTELRRPSPQLGT